MITLFLEQGAGMRVETREQDSVLILKIHGKMMGGPEATTFQETIKQHVAEGYRKFIFDLGEVDWMNSSGLGSLIGGLTTIKNAGGELKLAAVTEKIHSLFLITKLVTIFESYDTVDEALNSFPAGK
ncbi:MAG: anti-sigma factor antagonist [Candidatus Zixiibacteriota bacterium]|nr:MAG: anti-sigma factor antagonist [candidate division Zixibacteria bacterium]